MFISTPSMIINELGVPGLALAPHETNPPLIVDANTILPSTVALQSLKTISGRHTQILYSNCRVEHLKLGSCAPLNLLGDAFHGIARE